MTLWRLTLRSYRSEIGGGGDRGRRGESKGRWEGQERGKGEPTVLGWIMRCSSTAVNTKTKLHEQQISKEKRSKHEN